MVIFGKFKGITGGRREKFDLSMIKEILMSFMNDPCQMLGTQQSVS